MTRLLTRLRQWSCGRTEHSFVPTGGPGCPIDGEGFQVHCTWCGLIDWMCCTCVCAPDCRC